MTEAPKFFLHPFVGITRIRFDGYFSAISCEAPQLQKERCCYSTSKYHTNFSPVLKPEKEGSWGIHWVFFSQESTDNTANKDFYEIARVEKMQTQEFCIFI